MARTVLLLVVGLAAGLFVGAVLVPGADPSAAEPSGHEDEGDLLRAEQDARIGAVLDRLRDGSEFERKLALDDLLGLGEPALRRVATRIREAGDDDLHRELWIVHQLGRDARPIVPTLLERLRREGDEAERARTADEDRPSLAWQISHALEAVGPAAADAALGDLQALLDHPDGPTAAAALDALVATAREAPPLVALLEECLEDPRWQVRVVAARELGSLGALARPARPALIDALDDEATNVRSWAASSLEDLGPPPEAEVALLRLARDDDADDAARGNARYALGALERPSVEVLEEIARGLLEEPGHQQAWRVKAALRNHALPESVLRILAEALAGSTADARRTAAGLLGRADALPADVRRAIEEALRLETDGDAREAMERALRKRRER